MALPTVAISGQTTSRLAPTALKSAPCRSPTTRNPRYCLEREGAQVVAGEAECGEDDARNDAERPLEAQLQPAVNEKRLPEDEAIAQEVRRQVNLGLYRPQGLGAAVTSLLRIGPRGRGRGPICAS